mmetsp:Transcript_5889/g.16536  ORF Transcript_5889/g.16536 Transcript_5889/m.16536 type:complete len:87 (-) Transcript_5889:61-321(-)
MSFLFAIIPKQHALNASRWKVSGATKFSLCFYNYDFSNDVFDVSKWDVSSGIYFVTLLQTSSDGSIAISCFFQSVPLVAAWHVLKS